MRAARALGIAVVLLLGVAGCGTAADEQRGAQATSAAADEAPREAGEEATEPPGTEPPAAEPELLVGATLPPIASLVAHVGGERVEVHSLVPAGADAHTYEPSPADARTLGEAGAYFGVGLGLNEAALRLAEQSLPAGAPLVRLAEVVVPDDEIVHDHVHDDEDGASHDDEGAVTHTHDGDTHTHDGDEGEGPQGGPNAHVWLDVRYAMGFVEAIRDTLVDVDPEGAATYEANAEAALERLGALDAAISGAIATIPDGQRTMVVYHDAWTYFGQRYDIDVVAAVQPGDFSEPSAAEVRRIIDQIRDEDVPAVFGSEVFPSRVLDAIAEETGAEYIGELADDDPPGEPGDPSHSYEGLMVANARAIVEGLGGDPSALDHEALLPVAGSTVREPPPGDRSRRRDS